MDDTQVMLPAVLVLLLVLVLLAAMRAQRRRLNRLNEQPASPFGRRGYQALARARITDVRGEMAEPGSGHARFYLKMIVETLDDRKYPAETTWLVETSALGFMQVDQILTVRVDRAKPSVILPNAPWAQHDLQK